MPTEKTEVLYDVSQAEKQLKKLDKSVKKSGNTAKKSFGKDASGGLGKFGDTAGQISPKLGGLVTKFSGLATKLGAFAATASPAGIAVAGIGAAAVAVTASVVDLAGAMRSADAVLGDFLTNARKAQRFADLLSGSEDARRAFGFEEAKDTIAVKRLAITEDKIKTEVARDTAIRLIGIEKDKIRQIESAQKTAANKTLTLQKRLADRQRGDLVGSVGAGRPTGAAVVDLAAKAKSEAEKGNLETAEALLARAKELSAELGNHSFFTDKINSANKAINTSLKGQIKDSKAEEGTFASQLTAQKAFVTEATADLEIQKEKTKELTRQLTLLGAQTGVLSRQKKAEKRFTQVEQGQRDIGTGQVALEQQFGALGQEGLGTKISNAISDGFAAIRSPLTLGTVREGAGSLSIIEDTLERAIAGRAEGGFTTGEIDQLGKLAQISQEQLNILKTDKTAGALSLSDRRVTRLENQFEAIQQLQTGAQQLGPVGANQNIATRRNELLDEANRAQQNAAAISVNVNIEGGMIDETTVEQIADVVARRVRKETSKGAGAN